MYVPKSIVIADESDEVKKEAMRSKIKDYLARTELLRQRLRTDLDNSKRATNDLQELGKVIGQLIVH